eukprot:GHVP01067235.1.p2 GENE.GHVP01067235.1~~GHVP01067235.1.p2  ORF type:complete len:238 (-),score=48.53 GHVP01067235.1:503-1216(-)
MATGNRYNVFATRMNLTIYKNMHKRTAAGHSLLKKRTDALTACFSSLKSDLIRQKTTLIDQFKAASISLARFRYVSETGSMHSLETVSSNPLRVLTEYVYKAGISVPVYSLLNRKAIDPNVELAGSKELRDNTQKLYTELLSNILEIATLQKTYEKLSIAITESRRRTNSLEYLLLPKIENTIKGIDEELDEQDREDFFRIKMFQKKKQKDIQEPPEFTFEAYSLIEDPEADPDIIL